jgi:hypothetical protein
MNTPSRPLPAILAWIASLIISSFAPVCAEETRAGQTAEARAVGYGDVMG